MGGACYYGFCPCRKASYFRVVDSDTRSSNRRESVRVLSVSARINAALASASGSSAVRFPRDESEVEPQGIAVLEPALLAEGLLRHTRTLLQAAAGILPTGVDLFGPGLLALVRCCSLEQSRYLSPGEWGKLLGLDRLPEVKTLRRKISDLCGQDGQAAQWQSRLGGEWMAGAHSERGSVLRRRSCAYLSRSLTNLARRCVAHERLCLRGTTEYWVNGLGGAPFFVLTQPVNPG
jgi:hypothetical protein